MSNFPETRNPDHDARAFAQVVLPLPLDQPFTYSVPAALRHRIATGMRVVVPIQKRVETGTVVGIAADSDVENVRALIVGRGPALRCTCRHCDSYEGALHTRSCAAIGWPL